MRKGKLTPPELQECIFDIVKKRRAEVQLSVGIGEDCAALICDDYILVTSDPITTRCANPGELAIHINANDIAASGGEPIAVAMTILAPVNETIDQIKSIMQEAENAAKELNIEIIGGHTEFTDAVNRTIINCTMIGRVDKIITSTKSKVGDSIIMTKYAAIEGTLILADMFPNRVNSDSEVLDWMRENISVLKEGLIASKLNISAMHDITEGGVFGAIAEMCCGSSNGAVISVKDIPIKAVTMRLCEEIGINPYQLISSGSMIITSNLPDIIIDALQEKGIMATVIGVINNSGKVVADYTDRIEEVNVESDEITRVNEGKNI